MTRFFNIAGPCYAEKHYIIDSSTRIKVGIMDLIDQEQYFVIHAARQTGKTTLLKEYTRNINKQGAYHALYCSLEQLQGVTDPEKGIPEIVKSIKLALVNFNLPNAKEFASHVDFGDFTLILNQELTVYCRSLDKPLIVFFDEADCLSEQTLIAFLRQLRNGYANRPDVPFVHSLVLVGMRNIRDFKARIRPESDTLGSASPFNIIAESLTLNNFSREDIENLYLQHTAETGQNFETSMIDLVYEQTQGQPWLVNAIARECADKIAKKDYTLTITPDMASQAIQTLILRRDTHFDSLMERLKEPRVRRVIEPMLSGGSNIDRLSNDYLYTRDLGLIRDDRNKTEPANPIYAEVISRTLNWNTHADLMEQKPEYVAPRYIKNNRIDLEYLLRDFQEFWRENSEIWLERYDYKEAAPHLILQAFLQRVINGGGSIIREFAVGTRRVDLCLVYADKKYPIELKVYYNENTLPEGMDQTAKYMESMGAAEGVLFIFDRRSNISWEEKLYIRAENYKGKKIIVAGG